MANAASYGQTIAQCEQAIPNWTKDADGNCNAGTFYYGGDMSNCWPAMTEKACPPPTPLSCEAKGGFSKDTALFGSLTNGAMTCKDVTAGAKPEALGNVEGAIANLLQLEKTARLVSGRLHPVARSRRAARAPFERVRLPCAPPCRCRAATRAGPRSYVWAWSRSATSRATSRG